MKIKKIIVSLSAILSVGLGFAKSYQDFPNNGLLRELKNYTSQKVNCSEFSCNSINSINFELNNKSNKKEVVAKLNISARESSFVSLPFKSDEIKINAILLDNKVWYKFIESNGEFKVVVPEGNHTLSVSFNPTNSAILLTNNIQNINVSNELSLNERNGSNIISLKETKEAKNESNAGLEKSSYNTESFYQVSRTLYLDNTWKIKTVIQPLFDINKTTTLEIPLFKGEKVLNSDIKTESDKAIVSVSNQVISWDSTLNSVDKLSVPMIQSKFYTQVFSLYSSSLWKYNVKGKNPFYINGDTTSWALWNGESLDLSFKAPIILDGKTLSLSNLVVSLTKEHDTSFYNYSINAKTSLAGKMFFTIPEGYKIDSLNVNNQNVNIDKNTRKIPIDLNLGTNSISFKIFNENSQIIFKTFPYVEFSEKVFGAKYDLTSSNWILFSGGADINSEYILFSSLIVLLIIALITKKINYNLKLLSIIFILFGFLQNSLVVMLFLPILLGLVKFKDFVVERYNENKNTFEYNTYQFMLILFSIFFTISFLVTLKLGLLDEPSFWTLYGGNNISWFNELYSSSSIWYLEIDSTIYHIIMFAWAIFVSYQLINISKLVFKSIFNFELWIKKPIIENLNEKILKLENDDIK